jgi:hypothetical protein
VVDDVHAMHDLHTKCEPLHRVLESKCRVEDHGILLVDAAELDEVDEAIRITVVGRPIRFSPLCAGGSGKETDRAITYVSNPSNILWKFPVNKGEAAFTVATS